MKTTLVAAAVAAALAGCGAQEAPAPVVQEPIVERATPAPPAPRAAVPARATRRGTMRVAPLVGAPAARPARDATAADPRPARTRVPGSFRRSQIAVLRTLCATGAADPRCDGRKVNTKVAFAGMEAAR